MDNMEKFSRYWKMHVANLDNTHLFPMMYDIAYGKKDISAKFLSTLENGDLELIRSLTHSFHEKEQYIRFLMINNQYGYNIDIMYDDSLCMISLYVNENIIQIFLNRNNYVKAICVSDNNFKRGYKIETEDRIIENFPPPNKNVNIETIINSSSKNVILSYLTNRVVGSVINIKFIYHANGRLKKCSMSIAGKNVKMKMECGLHDNGFLRKLKFLQNENKTGPFVRGSNTGTILEEGLYTVWNDKSFRHGPWRIKRKDGSLLEGYYDHGEKVNTWKIYKDIFIVNKLYKGSSNVGVFMLPLSGPLV